MDSGVGAAVVSGVGAGDGAEVGVDVGDEEGTDVGTLVGIEVGGIYEDGVTVLPEGEGTNVGTDVGAEFGLGDGAELGLDVGTEVGIDVGIDVGKEVGKFDCDEDSDCEGTEVALVADVGEYVSVPEPVGWEVNEVGLNVDDGAGVADGYTVASSLLRSSLLAFWSLTEIKREQKYVKLR